MDYECKQELEGKFAKDKILVLKIGGIPTMVEKLPGNFGTKTYTWIVIKENGDWKVKSFLGEKSDSTNVLEEKEVLKITKFEVGKKSVKIWTSTDRALTYDAAGRESWIGSTKAKGAEKHANYWDFDMPKDYDCQTALKAIEKYFDLYDSKDALNEAKEIKVGMTVEEVEKILGKPEKKADMGDKIVFKYEDTIVTFVDGKVTNIEFR